MAAGAWYRMPEWAHDVLCGVGAFCGVLIAYALWMWARG